MRSTLSSVFTWTLRDMHSQLSWAVPLVSPGPQSRPEVIKTGLRRSLSRVGAHIPGPLPEAQVGSQPVLKVMYLLVKNLYLFFLEIPVRNEMKQMTVSPLHPFTRYLSNPQVNPFPGYHPSQGLPMGHYRSLLESSFGPSRSSCVTFLVVCATRLGFSMSMSPSTPFRFC